MAITFAQDYFRNSAGIEWEIYGKMSLDSSYPTGGYLVDPAQFGLSQVTSFTINGETDGYLFEYDKATARLKVYSGGGGGTFTGTPATLTGTNTAPAFTGNALAGHAHGLTTQTNNGTFSIWRIYVGAIVGGPYTIGETVTDGTTFGTGVVSGTGANRFGYNYIEFSSVAGTMLDGNVLTGGTSGATSTSTSVLVGLVTPTATPVAMMGVALSNGSTDFDALNLIVMAANNSRLHNPQMGTYDDVENLFMFGREEGSVSTRYAVTYLTNTTTSTSGGTPSGTNTAPVLTMNPYTPAGTISGGSGGAEIPNGTNLSTVTNIEFRVIGL